MLSFKMSPMIKPPQSRVKIRAQKSEKKKKKGNENLLHWFSCLGGYRNRLTGRVSSRDVRRSLTKASHPSATVSLPLEPLKLGLSLRSDAPAAVHFSRALPQTRVSRLLPRARASLTRSLARADACALEVALASPLRDHFQFQNDRANRRKKFRALKRVAPRCF